EEASLIAELRGAPRPPMRLRDLLGWTLRLVRGEVDVGRAHLACGRPLELGLGSDVPALARAVVAELQACTATTTHHLRTLCETLPLPGVDIGWLAAAIEARGGRVLDVPVYHRPVPPEAARCMR